MRRPKRKPARPTSLSGSAGVHFVCAELYMHGLIALPTVRNTKGMDVVVLTQGGKFLANLQVKTSAKKVSFWPISEHYEDWNGKNDYYVFVRYVGNEKFEAFLEPANRVIKDVNAVQEEEKKRGLVKWAPCWYLPKDAGIPRSQLRRRFFSRFHRLPQEGEITKLERERFFNRAEL
jgi:hypothetical protein